MTRRRQKKGACMYCHEEMTRNGMVRHLGSCAQRQRLDAINQAGKRHHREKQYHLQVQDAHGLGHWLQLEIRGSAKLMDLDDYLRGDLARMLWTPELVHHSRKTVHANSPRHV